MTDEEFPIKEISPEAMNTFKRLFPHKDNTPWEMPKGFELKGMDQYKSMPADVPTFPAVFTYNDPANPYTGKADSSGDKYGPIRPEKPTTKWDLLDDLHRTHLTMIFANTNCSECGATLRLASDFVQHFYLFDLKSWSTGYCKNRETNETTDTPEAKEEA